MLRCSPRSYSPLSRSPSPAPESRLSEIHATMRSLLCDCNQHMSLEEPESIVIESSGYVAELVHWSARGFRKVNADFLHGAVPHYETRKFYHPSSIASATSILADGFLKKRGGHERGFTEAVKGQLHLSHAWFNNKNKGIVFEGKLHGEVSRHSTIADHQEWESGWMDRFCNRPGHHIHKRKKGDSQYYMNEKTI